MVASVVQLWEQGEQTEEMQGLMEKVREHTMKLGVDVCLECGSSECRCNGEDKGVGANPTRKNRAAAFAENELGGHKQ